MPDPEFEALRREKPLGVALAAAVSSPALTLEAMPDVRTSTSGRLAIHLDLRVTGTDTGVPVPANDTLEVVGVAIDDRGRERARAGGRADVTNVGDTFVPPPVVLAAPGPGRYHVRLAVRSLALDRTGSIFLDVDVPKR